MKKIEWIAFKLKDREAVQWTPKSDMDRRVASFIYEVLVKDLKKFGNIDAFLMGVRAEGHDNKFVCFAGTPRRIIPIISHALSSIAAFVEKGPDGGDEEDEE